jgi:uncharacterized LabA/DUF88 family protein
MVDLPDATIVHGPRQEKYGAILLDMESFFISRQQFTEKPDSTKSYDSSGFAEDMQFFLPWMLKQFDGFKLRALRAYVPHEGFRIKSNDDSTGFTYNKEKFHPAADLLEFGIEPVIVPVLAKRKNAIDIRIVADSMPYCSPLLPTQRILLVSGDSDYVPAVLAWRQAGIDVVVVGFKKPIGTRDPDIWYVPKIAPRFYLFENLKDEHEKNALAELKKEQKERIGHTAHYYRMALQETEPRFYLVAPEDWISFTSSIFDAMGTGEATMEALVSYVRSELSDNSRDTNVIVRMVVSQLRDSGCLRPIGGAAADPQDRWEQPLELNPDLDTVEAMRLHTQRAIVATLRQRLVGLEDPRPLEVPAMAELFYGPEPSPDELAAVEKLLAEKLPVAPAGA